MQFANFVDKSAEDTGSDDVRDPAVAAQSGTSRGAIGGVDGPPCDLVEHRKENEPGFFALTFVPRLTRKVPRPPVSVVFVLDCSGSMEGRSLVPAKAALRLCVRQLEPGDSFNLITFADTFRNFAPVPVAVSDASLAKADRWIQRIPVQVEH